jgi:outer membrane protein TolC
MRCSHQLFVSLTVFAIMPALAVAQINQNLTLRQAEQIALQNHPQIQAAADLASASKAQVTQARSAYYPTVYGSFTGV